MKKQLKHFYDIYKGVSLNLIENKFGNSMIYFILCYVNILT